MTSLIADIGGTNTRCGTSGTTGPEHIARFRNANYASVGGLLTDYIATLPTDCKPDNAIIAVAAPVRGDQVKMTNLDWHFSATALCNELRLNDLRVLNDFEAQAYALPALHPSSLLQVGSGQVRSGAPKGVLGPGTGLGVATLLPVGQDWHALPGEGGHVSMAAGNAREAAVIQAARERYGHCSAERLISGPGLSLLHELLHEEAGVDAPEIDRRMAAGDAAAAESFERFCQLLGTVAANLALTVGAFGGIYIGGGILPRHAERFAASGFRTRFEDKGRYDAYLAEIPTFLITEAEPALIGLWTRAPR